eukprot:TRINITY_DN2331_c0_g1_i2.p1 TRINITY_DN2331_c0_g1~~TRINITY_DN2331_c0_g1_i2.p1  ORF type:complete len:229 (+),score=2.09 TRINITY_DN2331_c0_g1_i2:56-742(+)
MGRKGINTPFVRAHTGPVSYKYSRRLDFVKDYSPATQAVDRENRHRFYRTNSRHWKSLEQLPRNPTPRPNLDPCTVAKEKKKSAGQTTRKLGRATTWTFKPSNSHMFRTINRNSQLSSRLYKPRHADRTYCFSWKWEKDKPAATKGFRACTKRDKLMFRKPLTAANTGRKIGSRHDRSSRVPNIPWQSLRRSSSASKIGSLHHINEPIKHQPIIRTTANIPVPLKYQG